MIVDAVGVTKSLKTDSRPLEKKPTVPLKDLLGAIAVGVRDDDLFSSIANRLIRLEKQITEKEKILFSDKTNGKTISQVSKELLIAYDPDIIEDIRLKVESAFAGSPLRKKRMKLIADIRNLLKQPHQHSQVTSIPLSKMYGNRTSR